MRSRGLFALGGAFAAVGLTAWMVLLYSFEPVGNAAVGVDREYAQKYYLSELDLAQYANSIGAELRRAALVLVAGGLLLMARGSRRAIAAALAVAATATAADALLAWSDVDSVATVILAGAVATVAAVAVGVAGWRSAADPARPQLWFLIYAAIAAVSAPLTLLVTPLQGLSFAISVQVAAVAVIVALPVAALVAALAVRGAVAPAGAVGALVVATGVAAALGAYWAQVPREAITDGHLPDTVLLALLARLPVPLLLAGAVGLACGAWRFAQAPLRVAGLIVAAAAIAVPVESTMGSLLGRPEVPLAGAVLGALAWVAVSHSLREPDDGPATRADGVSDLPPPPRSWLPGGVGAGLAAAGVAIWAAGVAVFEPAARATYDEWDTAAQHGRYYGDADDMANLAVWAKDLRWAAIVLAVGGLLLLTMGTARRGRVVAAAVGVWLVADLVLDRVNLHGWVVAGVVAAGAGALVVFTVRAARRGGIATGSNGIQVVYSGVAGCVATVTMAGLDPNVAEYVPRFALPTATVLGPLLMVAAAATAVSAGRHVGAPRALAGLLLAAVGAAATVVLTRDLVAPGTVLDLADRDVFAAMGWVIGGLIVALALLSGAVRADWRSLGAFAALGGLVALGAGKAIFDGAVATGYLLQRFLIPMTGDEKFFDGYPMVLSGLVAGVVVGYAALLPQAVAAGPTRLDPFEPAAQPDEPVLVPA